MISLTQTAERTTDLSSINNYVFQRHLTAYKALITRGLLGKTVLELGCGDGYGMHVLAPHVESYVAIDKKHPGKRLPDNATFLQTKLPLLPMISDDSFDTVICFQVIEHIKKDIALLQECFRVLKPGGRLILTTPNKLMSLTRNPFHIREYTPTEMKLAVSKVFSQHSIYGIYGNNKIMEYYFENKKQVEQITKYDVFNLQYTLPRPLLMFPYSIFNNLSRLLIFKSKEDITASIHYSDFSIHEVSDSCLDYFIEALK